MTSTSSILRKGRGRANLFWLAGYLATAAAVVVLVLHARSVVLRDLATPEARAQWQEWRDAPANQDTAAPVRRKPPSTAEPPALVLMRDYFAGVMSGAVIFSSLLFAAIMMAIRGVFSSTKLGGHPNSLSPRGRRPG